MNSEQIQNINKNQLYLKKDKELEFIKNNHSLIIKLCEKICYSKVKKFDGEFSTNSIYSFGHHPYTMLFDDSGSGIWLCPRVIIEYKNRLFKINSKSIMIRSNTTFAAGSKPEDRKINKIKEIENNIISTFIPKIRIESFKPREVGQLIRPLIKQEYDTLVADVFKSFEKMIASGKYGINEYIDLQLSESKFNNRKKTSQFQKLKNFFKNKINVKNFSEGEILEAFKEAQVYTVIKT